jgi:hypothetical protein
MSKGNLCGRAAKDARKASYFVIGQDNIRVAWVVPILERYRLQIRQTLTQIKA